MTELKNYNPDVLSCLANLSSDEVFTPPDLASAMLDLLPQELFASPDTTFLDPSCKTGVFPREIAKRLIKGLETEIPNLQERLDHIFTKQIFALPITELTALLTRRSLYCSKKADGKYSVCKAFRRNSDGNVKFVAGTHVWNNRGRCRFCGANRATYEREDSLETHTYHFIHTENPEKIFAMPANLDFHFDVIIGNPPYQLSDGGAQASASPLYHKFIRQAKKLNPRYLSMIVPARWYAGGKGLDDFRDEMLNDKRIRVLVDYFNAEDCFPGVEIKGGVCYFLWDRDNAGVCKVVSRHGENEKIAFRPLRDENNNSFLRFNEAVEIVKKVASNKENSFSKLVSPRKPFGLNTTAVGKNKSTTRTIRLYANKKLSSVSNFIEARDIPEGYELINAHKVLITRAYGAGSMFPHQILNIPFYAEPNSACSETYLVVGPFKNKEICENVISYIRTKFFRFLVLQKKNTQDATRDVYTLVPVQDFSKPWTDEELYKKYGLTDEEIAFIESMIRPMGQPTTEAPEEAEGGAE